MSTSTTTDVVQSAMHERDNVFSAMHERDNVFIEGGKCVTWYARTRRPSQPCVIPTESRVQRVSLSAWQQASKQASKE